MDPFEVLGLEPTLTLPRDELESRYRTLLREFHPDRSAHAPPAERRMRVQKAVEVNEAYRVLRNDLKRAEALLRLKGCEVNEDDKAADPAFLMEVMELSEELSDAKFNKDQKALERLVESGTKKRAATLEALERSLERNSLDDAALALGRLRYYERFVEQAEEAAEALE